MRCSSRIVPPLKAYPEVQAHVASLRLYLDRYRYAHGWFPWAVVIAPLLNLLLPWYIAALPLLIAAAAMFYFERYCLAPIHAIHCRSGEGYISIYDDWVCGNCKKTHTKTIHLPWRRTWADECTGKFCGVPHSVICPSCRNPIIFDDYAFERSPDKSAWLPGYPPVEATPAPTPALRPPRHIDKHLR
jgi:hypothetical protein